MPAFRIKFFLLVGWQTLLLLSLLGFKYSTVITGTTVYLEPVPVNPRDLFRGDYVALRYTISRLDLESLDLHAGKAQLKPGESVYVLLAPATDETGPVRSGPTGQAWKQPWAAVALYGHKPTEDELYRVSHQAVFIRGKILNHWKHIVELEYGIESYFVPEGKGHLLERAPAKAMRVEVKVDHNGSAVIRRVLLNGKTVP